jgi:hypothetical protein
MWSVSSVSNMAGDTSSNGLPILVGFLLWSTRNIARNLGLKSNPISVRAMLQWTPAKFWLTEDDGGDPGHEFEDVLEQLCGAGASYPDPKTGKYPPLTNSGFFTDNQLEAMKCFAPEQLPVLVTLAREFAVCDRWFSSMPGPTWPNRFFVHAASSGGLVASLSGIKTAETGLLRDFDFNHGTIYNRLNDANLPWAIFQGDEFPQSRAIEGLDDDQFIDFDDEFADRVNDPDFDLAYIFIEPSYGNVITSSLKAGDYTCGNSQHPLDDVTRGERLIKKVYETIRNSPHWEKSMLLITYDEHGGFFDHVSPPGTTAPGDGVSEAVGEEGESNPKNFDFTQLGVRVPAVVISPFVPRGTIDHTVYDHTSLLATVELRFGLPPLTNRDSSAAPFDHLFSRAIPRDAPVTLPDPPDSGFRCDREGGPGALVNAAGELSEHPGLAIPITLIPFLLIAFRREYRATPAARRPAIITEFRKIQTKQSALEYMHRVRLKLKAGPIGFEQ